MKILIIDDDLSLLQLLDNQLTSRGFLVVTAFDGEEGLKKAYQGQPDLIIIDVTLPGMDGFEACKRLRDFTDVPIIFLTARNTDSGVLKGFGSGADDYLKKPFNIEELLARIRAILRRMIRTEFDPDFYCDDHLEIDLRRKVVSLNSEHIHLSGTEFRLLSFFVRRRGDVLPHELLIDEVWGPGFSDSTSLLQLYIGYLRKKIDQDHDRPKYINTEWGIGYWFKPD
jgi:two-component system KDP operon response regulator KdpE